MKLDEEKAAKAEASKLRRQRELEKMRAKSIEMQEKVSPITIHIWFKHATSHWC